jgi:predicted porin
MKRFPMGRIPGMTALAAATLLAAGVPVAAQAQSNVTIYGSLDAGMAYVNNQGGNANWIAQQGATQPDRWGFRGVEDLGGGNRAIFQLETASRRSRATPSRPARCSTASRGSVCSRTRWVRSPSVT